MISFLKKIWNHNNSGVYGTIAYWVSLPFVEFSIQAWKHSIMLSLYNGSCDSNGDSCNTWFLTNMSASELILTGVQASLVVYAFILIVQFPDRLVEREKAQKLDNNYYAKYDALSQDEE